MQETSGLNPLPRSQCIQLPQHMTSPEVQLTQIVWRSACNQTSIQSSVTGPSTLSQYSSVGHQVTDQFAQLKTMLISILDQRQETTRTTFCNCVASDVDTLAHRDFQTFRNKAVKLLSNIQSSAEEKSCPPRKPQPLTLPRSSSGASTFIPQAFQHSTSTICEGIYCNDPRDSDATSAELSDNQRIAAVK